MKKLTLVLCVILMISLLSACGRVETTEASTPWIQTEEYSNIGGSVPATDFGSSFIYISNYLSPLIDADRMTEWNNSVQEYSENHADPYLYDNIYEFIRFFDIPRDELEKLYYSTDLYYRSDYDFDLLYGDDIESVYEYYRGENEDFLKRLTESDLKWSIRMYVGVEKFNEWIYDTKMPENKGGDYSDVLWSIAEAVHEFGISRSDLKYIIATMYTDEDAVIESEVYDDGSIVTVSSSNVKMYDYDFDKIYDGYDEIEKMIESGVPGYKIDESIRK